MDSANPKEEMDSTESKDKMDSTEPKDKMDENREEVTVREVKLGTRVVQYPSEYLQPLQDSNHLLHDVQALRQEMEDKGFLYIRGLHDREEVLTARLAVLNYLHKVKDGILDPEYPIETGVLHEGCGVGCIPMMEGRNEMSHSEAVLKVIEGPRPMKFFEKYFGGREVRTLDFKWLRAVHQTGFTGAHVDNVYMSRGSKELLTMWTPVGDINVEMGTLAMCEGSNSLPGFNKFRNLYGNLDVDEGGFKGTGWFTTDPFEITDKFGGQWKTVDFKAGDVMIFSMKTLHMSTVNLTHYARVSCDTRWQPKEDKADPRFVGNFEEIKKKFGYFSLEQDESKEENTIEYFRNIWGL